MTTGTILGRYDAVAVRALLEESGVLEALERKGFGALAVDIDSAGRALPHILLAGHKAGQRHVLLDACIGEAVVRPDVFRRRGYRMDTPVELAVVHWVREEDPTAAFAADRPPLPLQHHPGLGVLRRAFRVAVRMATDLGKDGVVSIPKFFHDAAIFFHSRLFLFLDGEEQGRFEALVRDLGHLSLSEASLAVVAGCVHGADGAVLPWAPGYQVFPLSERLTAYFHSSEYAAQVAKGRNGCHFSCVADAVARARRGVAATEGGIPTVAKAASR